jgi:hypothetical protein
MTCSLSATIIAGFVIFRVTHTVAKLVSMSDLGKS